MIYWKGNKLHSLLYDGGVIQAKYLDYTPLWQNEFAIGRAFVEEMGIAFNSEIKLTDKSNYISFRRVSKKKIKNNNFRKLVKISFRESIPLVSDNLDIDDFPNRFAIKTKNIDLLRELISRGKKVTWFEPDLYTQANYLGILNFEHVFLDPYINTHIIFPSGEAVPEKEVVHKIMNGSWSIKYSKLIGFNIKDVHDRINWKVYNALRYRKNLSYSGGGFFSEPVIVNLYNIFSLTYLIWKQSQLNVMTAKKRIVHTG